MASAIRYYLLSLFEPNAAKNAVKKVMPDLAS
jgi:hypothetical protein